jgi:hypothetical protein
MAEAVGSVYRSAQFDLEPALGELRSGGTAVPS